MTLDDIMPVRVVLDELEAIAAAEAKAGDGRALRTFRRLRQAAMLRKPSPKPRQLHQDDGA